MNQQLIEQLQQGDRKYTSYLVNICREQAQSPHFLEALLSAFQKKH